MGLFQGIVGGLANAAGATGVSSEITKRKDEKRELSRDELHAKTDFIINDVNRLYKDKANLQPGVDDKAIAAIQGQLDKYEGQLTDLFHPEKNPGHGQHLASVFGQIFGKKKQQAPVTTPGEAKERAAGIFSGSLAGIEPDAFKTFQSTYKEATGKDLPPEVAEQWARKQGGVPSKPDWKPFKLGERTVYFDVGKPDSIPPEATAVVGGGTAKGLKYDAATDEVIDNANGKRYTRDAVNAPQEVRDMFAGAAKSAATKQKNAVDLANVRGVSYGLNRPISVLDSRNGNAPTEVTMADIKKEPGRYQPAGPTMTALAQENLMQDIAGTSQQARQSITNLKTDFPPEMRVKLAVAMRDNDPGGALGQLVSSGALGSLTQDQQDFLIAINQLTENAMAMRAVLKTGQGAEDIRSAIRNTLPGVLSPDKSFALRQLDAFDKTLARLHRGVPKVTLPVNAGEAKDRLQGAGSGKMVKMKAPSGAIKEVPADQVEHYKQLGATVVQ